MDTSIVVSVITVSGSVLIAALTFYLTKRHERDAQWQNQKLNHYKVLLSSISALTEEGPHRYEADRNFALAANTIALAASQPVILALMAFHDEIKVSNPDKSLARHDELLRTLLLEICKDIGLSGDDDPTTFQFHLIGQPPSALPEAAKWDRNRPASRS